MSQKTNLNVSPYYDDFDENNNFHKVLFKPGFPVQSRELTTLQSILQNQISSFANKFLKDGAVVIPGNVTYNSLYYAVKLNPSNSGIDIGLYIKSLIGKRILGQISGITAYVQNAILDSESEVGSYTIYVNYLSSNSSFQISQFVNGENLICQDTFTYDFGTINSGDIVATLIDTNATSIASSVSMERGIYYIRGTFVDVNDQTIILDQYSNLPSYRVGLYINEEIVNASSDNSLYDNARGFSNFAAPGADRLKITATLGKKSLNDFDDKNFIEILRISGGVVKKLQDTNSYSLIRDYLAKRTYDESGDYSLDSFSIDVDDSLNDLISPSGLFFSNQKTDQGNTPNENLLSLKISPGRAYVRGFDIEKSGTTILDVDKPRETEAVGLSAVPFQMGNLLKVNNVSGIPFLGIDNNFTINLHNLRKSSNIVGSGTTIGTARIYSFAPSDTPYQDSSTQWDLHLFDIQTYTVLTVNQTLTSVNCPNTSYIKGLSSGASGYLVNSPNNSELTISQTSGSFIIGEQISINGSTSISRTITNIKEYTTEDIKSVFQNSSITGLTSSFVADTVLQRRVLSNFNISDQLVINSSLGIASCTGRNFSGIRSDTIIRYQRVGFLTETFNRIVSVSSDGLYLNLTGVGTVFNVCDGGVPTSNTTTTFTVGSPLILDQENASLYAELGDKNISEVSLSSSNLIITKQIQGKTTNNIGRLVISLSDVGISSASFLPFDSERYSVFYDDGSIEPLNSSKFTLSNNSTEVVFSGLSPNRSNIIVNATLQKNSVSSKRKIYVRSETLLVDKTANSALVSTSGLSTSQYYGMRVEDSEISLNIADVVKVIAIYESLNTSSPVLDKLTFSSGLNLDSQSVLGEKIIGFTSKACAQIVTRLSSTEIEFVYLNSNRFIVGETVNFEESNISASIQSITKGLYVDRTRDFTLNKGQKEQYYDYSRIIRNSNTLTPTRKLLVIYDYYDVQTNDIGDLYTVNSYDAQRYKNDIPVLKNNTRLTDIIDFRPRVSRFTSTTSSPFDFTSRNFSAAGLNSTLILTSGESSSIGYKKYLPRTDKIVLNKNGNFSLLKGNSSSNPKEPRSVEDSMDIAIINLPAYLYDVSDVKISLIDNKRYTMRDIAKLEDRITNLEIASSLSLLEVDTKSLQIRDSDGISRFKSGFFVDAFKTTDFIDLTDSNTRFSINKETEELCSDVSLYSLKSQVSLAPSANIFNDDFSNNLILQDPNVRKTGDLVTLNYSEVEWSDLAQNFATREQGINPFGVTNYNGNLKLRPSSDTWVRTVLSQNGILTRTESDWTNTYLQNLVTGGSYSNYMRSRNIEFYASSLQPRTQYYGFLDGNSSIDIIPKLLQISMTSGSFQIGEDVYGYVGNEQICCFRLASQNHKFGDYRSPSKTYSENPYTSVAFPLLYSGSSTVLNIDTYSLAEDSIGKYFGYVVNGMILIGKTSGAQATVSNQSLITDNFGDLIGCLYIRNPLANPSPPVLISKGTKTFKISSSSTNSSLSTVSFTQSSFYASGIVNSSLYSDSIVIRKPPVALPLSSLRQDPLSQTFRTDNDGGFLSSIDLYFRDVDQNEKVFIEIRETNDDGTPKNKLVQDFARAELLPSEITTSNDGSIATNIKFDSPIYLQPNKKYAICLLCPTSNLYKVWVAVTNQATVASQNLPNAQQVIYSNNFSGGNLYRPQNGSTWITSLDEDLKFKLYRCSFSSNPGVVYFNNPSISIGSSFGKYDANIEKLQNNPIKTLPRKLVVGITTSSNIQTIFVPGTKVIEGSSYGYVEQLGGNIGGITTSNVGAGYSAGTFNSVPLYTITGFGQGATANITFGTVSGKTRSSITSVSIANTGSGYVVGDVLGITTDSVGRGFGARITVSSVPTTNRIYLTNVQGSQFTPGQTISYYNGTTNVSLAGTVVSNSYTLNDLYSGNVFEVQHYNHGMHSDNNFVTINGVFPDTIPEQITNPIVSTNTTISVANTSYFTTFEGNTVGAANTGYVLINNEIISYYGVGTNTLLINQRAENDSLSRNHSIGDLMYKYELNGVSLTRINKTHNMPTNTTLKSLRDFDTYHLEFDRTTRTDLNFKDQKNIGGYNCSATQNYQFNSIIPQFNIISPERTLTSSLLRTISGTSVGGNETSFLDQGFESIDLNQVNNLSSPRLVCSRVNEINNLTNSPLFNNKSLTLGIRLETTSSNVSPAIDLSEAASFILMRNRINNPISNYTYDPRANQLTNDPHKTVYISKKIDLSKPSTSLKVLITAYRDYSSDFRVFYRLFKADSSEIDQSYRLFPGYNNLIDTDGDNIGDRIIDISLNDGSSDVFVRPSVANEFLEYQFTANDIDQFTGFSIKIVMNGTNESRPPRFADIRAIALV